MTGSRSRLWVTWTIGLAIGCSGEAPLVSEYTSRMGRSPHTCRAKAPGERVSPHSTAP